MTIVFIANADSPHTIQWAQYLSSALQHKVIIISFHKPEGNIYDLKIIWIKPIKYISVLNYLVKIFKIKKIVRKINPDIIIGYRITSHGFIASVVASNQLLILAAQGENILSRRRPILTRPFVKYAIKKADLIHSWGSHMTKRLEELGADPGKILTLPRGVKDIFFQKKQRSYYKDKIKIISTRALLKEYNFDVALKALAILKEKYINFEYLIVGDGPYSDYLKKLSDKLGLNQYVKFISRINYEKLPPILKQCDIYLSCVATDGVSSSLLEAMASRVFPLVVNNHANKIWISKYRDNILVEEKDIKKLSDCLLFAINDIEMRRESIDFYYHKVEKHAKWETNMKIMERKYFELMNKS